MHVITEHIPGTGIRMSSHRGEYIFGISAMSNPGVQYTNEEEVDICAAFIRFYTARSQFSSIPVIEKSDSVHFGEIQNYDGPIYKFISENDWNRFYSKGSIKIDRVETYTTLEYGKGPLDAWEGFGISFVWDGNRTSPILFRNNPAAHIFCASTCGEPSKEMDERFGNCVIRIANPDKFFQIMAKKTNTKFLSNKIVEYTSCKAIRYEEPLFGIRCSQFMKRYIRNGKYYLRGNDRKFFLKMLDRSHDVSIFCKPKRVVSVDGGTPKCFDFEKEARAIFYSDVNQRGALFTGECEELAGLIERVR